MSTSFDGLGAVLPPPMTHILLFTLSALVSPVGLGMLAMVDDRIPHRVINKGIRGIDVASQP